jgi:hypothetical protein
MTLEELSHQFKIPLEDLKAMRVEGLLSEPLHPQEINYYNTQKKEGPQSIRLHLK